MLGFSSNICTSLFNSGNDAGKSAKLLLSNSTCVNTKLDASLIGSSAMFLTYVLSGTEPDNAYALE